jgi:hypothetical protein
VLPQNASWGRGILLCFGREKQNFFGQNSQNSLRILRLVDSLAPFSRACREVNTPGMMIPIDKDTLAIVETTKQS